MNRGGRFFLAAHAGLHHHSMLDRKLQFLQFLQTEIAQQKLGKIGAVRSIQFDERGWPVLLTLHGGRTAGIHVCDTIDNNFPQLLQEIQDRHRPNVRMILFRRHAAQTPVASVRQLFKTEGIDIVPQHLPPALDTVPSLKHLLDVCRC
jgi:hypothetical protein